MSFDPHANFASSLVNIPPSPADSGTTLSVKPGDGKNFPFEGNCNATVWQGGVQATRDNAEIVRIVNIPTTIIASGSNGVALPQAIIHVDDESTFPSGGGTASIHIGSGVFTTIAYTGTASGQLTGCTGGTGTMTSGHYVVGDDFTISREDEDPSFGVAKRSILKNDQIEATITAKTLTDIESAVGGETVIGVFEGIVWNPINPTLALFGPLTFRYNVPIDPVTLSFGSFNELVSLPLMVYGSGVIGSFQNFQIDLIDTRTDSYTLNLAILITNAPQTEQMVLAGSVVVNNSLINDTGQILPGDLTPALTGSDLSYNSSTGEVSSAAGDTYSVLAMIFGNWT